MAYKSQLELETQWTTAEGVDGVCYRFGDLVEVEKGKSKGAAGEIIALVAIDPEPIYLIELPTGKSVSAAQSELKEPRGNSGRTLIIRPNPGSPKNKNA